MKRTHIPLFEDFVQDQQDDNAPTQDAATSAPIPVQNDTEPAASTNNSTLTVSAIVEGDMQITFTITEIREIAENVTLVMTGDPNIKGQNANRKLNISSPKNRKVFNGPIYDEARKIVYTRATFDGTLTPLNAATVAHSRGINVTMD